MEARLHDYKRDAMLAFVRANKLNRVITSGGRKPKIGIITTGKSYLDVRQAFDELGIDEVKCNDLGLRLYKVACPWPLSQRELKEFAEGLDLIIVVEEKRSLIEVQVREELYGTANQPVVHRQEGRAGAAGCSRSRARSIRTTSRSASASALLKYGHRREARGPRRAAEGGAAARSRETEDVAARIAVFLLRLPAQFLDRGAGGHARLCRHRLPLHGAVDGPHDARLHPDGRRGRELDRRGAVLASATHVFQNIGDGTYNHSGYLAIRAAIASGVNITYKILFNDAVAMTGGQRNDGGLTVPIRSRARSRPKAPSASSSSPTSRRNIRPARNGPTGITHPSSRRPEGGAEGARRDSRLSRC